MSGTGLPTGGPLRIALVSETWFPQVNGVSRSLEKLVESLAGCGDTIRLFIPRYPENCLPTGVSAATFRSISLPFYSEVLIPVAMPATVARELAGFRPDIVHIATEGPLGRAAMTALIDDPVRMAGMAENARRYAVGQNWETINAVVRRRYLEVVQAGTGRLPLPGAPPSKGVPSCS